MCVLWILQISFYNLFRDTVTQHGALNSIKLILLENSKIQFQKWRERENFCEFFNCDSLLSASLAPLDFVFFYAQMHII